MATEDKLIFLSKGYKVTRIDSFSKAETNKFQFRQKNIFDYEINELNTFDVYYLRFLIHTLSEQECDQLFARLALLPPETLITIETKSTIDITKEEKLETFFESPVGDKYFRMHYSKNHIAKKISDKFIILEASESADVAKFKSKNPFCLRYIIQPKQ